MTHSRKHVLCIRTGISCKLYVYHPATWARSCRSYRSSALEDLNHLKLLSPFESAVPWAGLILMLRWGGLNTKPPRHRRCDGVLVTVIRYTLPLILRGTIVNRTYGIHKNLLGIYLAIFTDNIWSYWLWSPVIVRGTILNRTYSTHENLCIYLFLLTKFATVPRKIIGYTMGTLMRYALLIGYIVGTYCEPLLPV